MTERTCAACQKPIQPDDFFTYAMRGSDATTGDFGIVMGNLVLVHVPTCPNRYTTEEWKAQHPDTLVINPAAPL